MKRTRTQTSNSPARRERKRRDATVSLEDPMWTIQHVSKFLGCSDEHAARWLEEHDVARQDIGLGEERQALRVLPADVQAAFNKCKVSDPIVSTRRQRGTGYVPKYRGINNDVIIPEPQRRRRSA